MSFNSLGYALFLAVVVALYWRLPRRGQNVLLLAASYFFYGSWDWRFLSLIWLSTIVDFYVGRAMAQSTDEKLRWRLMLVSLCTNLGILGFFKYFGFFSESLVDLFSVLGWQPDWVTLNVILPVGISFYTFQTLSYTIDIYRRKLDACPSLLDFALFVAFFPQLVAGPIERASRFIPQVRKEREFSADRFTRGLGLILVGLVKKVAIADGVARQVNVVFSGDSAGALSIVLATYLFAIQIYGDFSGYTDIARGSAKLLGFELMLNFDVPYASVNPQEFWNRWHISLSSWLRDYLYIPLGGNRGGPIATYRNLMTTMVLGGLWHGAAWNYVLWGFYQGVMLCTHRMWLGKKRPTAIGFARRLVGAAFFFQFVCYGWLLFRAESLAQIGAFTTQLVTGPWSLEDTVGLPSIAALVAIPVIVLLDVFSLRFDDTAVYRRLPPSLRALFYVVLSILVLMGLSAPAADFIYFQF